MKNIKKLVAIALMSTIGSTLLINSKAVYAINEISLEPISKVVATMYGDTTTSKGFTWYTDTTITATDLQVVEKVSAEEADFSSALKFRGESYLSTNSTNPNNSLKKEELVHKVVATGLKENTTYYYRVGDADNNIWSKIGTFKTAPKSGEFTFINMADPQAKTEEECILSSQTIEKAFRAVPNADFISINGDFVDKGYEEKQWDWFLGYSQENLLNTTMVPVAGNHEEYENTFIDHFNIHTPEGSDTTTGAYYSYDYSNTHFIIFNNNEDSEEYRNFSTEQIEWIKKDVKQARANGAQWIIAKMHKGPYTTSNHATDEDIMGENGTRTKVSLLLEELGIDLVLQGHDHIYSRTLPIKNGHATNPKTILEFVQGVGINGLGSEVEYSLNPEGTIYTTPASSGAKVYGLNKSIDKSYYDLFAEAPESPAFQYGEDPDKPGRPARGHIQNFFEIKVHGPELTVINYEIDQNKNNAEPRVVSSFGILKDDAVLEREEVSNAIEQIDKIPEEVTLESKELVETARNAYDAVREENKGLVTNYNKLVQAEGKISKLEEDKNNKDAAEKVEALINGLPEKVTKDDKSKIEAARKAYNELTDEQKYVVSNLSKLEKAEADLKKLLEGEIVIPPTTGNGDNSTKPDVDKEEGKGDGKPNKPGTLPNTGVENNLPFLMATLTTSIGMVMLKKKK